MDVMYVTTLPGSHPLLACMAESIGIAIVAGILLLWHWQENWQH
jgi:hypothetical protein